MSETVQTQSPKEDVNTNTNNIIYILFLVNIIVPFTALVGVIMAYVNKGDAPEVLQSHYQFQIRTFWIGLLYGFIGVVLTVILIGWLVLFFTLIWWIVRNVKGMQLLGKQAAIANPTSWMFG